MSGLVNDILLQVRYIPRALVFAIFLIPLYIFIKENEQYVLRSKIASILKESKTLIFLLYLSYILVGTLFTRSITNPYKNVFNHFGLFINGEINLESVENIIIFIPYTFLFLLAHKPLSPWKSSLILSTATSSFVEFSQLIFWLGEFQLSDLFHNILGGMIGCWIWYIFKLLIYIINNI